MVNECCGCQPPQAPEPQKICESADLYYEACGWNYPIFRSIYGQAEHVDFEFNDDVPCPDRVTYYRNVSSTDGENSFSLESDIDAVFSGLTGAPVPNTTTGTPYTSTNEVTSYSGGVFSGSSVTLTFSNPVTMEDVYGVALTQETVWSGSSCSTSLEMVYAECDSVATEAPFYVNATKVRYKIGIPSTDEYGNYPTVKEAWDVCEASTPGECGPEPMPRSYYSAQWDEVFVPDSWVAWKELYDAYHAAVLAHDQWEEDFYNYITYGPDYDEWLTLESEYVAAVAAHEAWETCQTETPGECGTEPVIPYLPPAPPYYPDPGSEPSVPDDPGEPEDPLILIASRSWQWDGDMENQFSDWFEMEPPFDEAPGSVRVGNMLVKHYRSNQFGVKPTSYGSVYDV